MSNETDKAKARLTADAPRVPPIPPEDFLSSGLTVLNLAATGHPDRFIAKGQYLYLVGDSSSGKSWLSFQVFAEAARNKAFKKHRFIFDNAENGALMDVARYFGQSVLDRLEPPRGNADNPTYSSTVQEMFFNVDDALDAGPCVYVMDSVDAVNADEDEDKFEEEKQAFEKGKDAGGSYGMAKPKYISRNINRVVKRLRDTGSVLVLISQTRDKVGGMIPGQKTRAGGRALKFYAHLEIWSSVRGPLKRTAAGKEREVGSLIQLDIQKNRLSGWEGKVPLLPFYRSSGFDEAGACVDFLIDEGYWEEAKSKGQAPKVRAKELEFEGKKEDLIAKVQSEERDRELQLLVAKVWKDIEAACAVNRRPRYT